MDLQPVTLLVAFSVHIALGNEIDSSQSLQFSRFIIFVFISS